MPKLCFFNRYIQGCDDYNNLTNLDAVDIFRSQNVPLLQFIKQDFSSFNLCLQFTSITFEDGFERRQFFFCVLNFTHRNQQCVVIRPKTATRKCTKHNSDA